MGDTLDRPLPAVDRNKCDNDGRRSLMIVVKKGWTDNFEVMPIIRIQECEDDDQGGQDDQPPV